MTRWLERLAMSVIGILVLLMAAPLLYADGKLRRGSAWIAK